MPLRGKALHAGEYAMAWAYGHLLTIGRESAGKLDVPAVVVTRQVENLDSSGP